MNIIRRYRKAKLIFIAYNFYPRGGSTVSANHYHRYWSEQGEIVEKISKDSRFGFIRILLAFLFGKKLMMNGLYCFYFWDLILFSLLRNDTVIYLQESEDALKHFKSVVPFKFKLLTLILRRNRIACISQLQQQYIVRQFGARRTQLIYNTLPHIQKITSNSSEIAILMAGYLMARKGVTFFSELADYAYKEQPTWKFYWIGDGKTSGLYLSKNVEWLGYQSNPHYFYEKIDVFFLSSYDEPLGLVCAEALMHQKKCVVYRNTGFAELIENTEGCAVYEKYEVEAAYDAIVKAIAQPLNTQKVETMLEEVSSIENFSQKLDRWLDL
jgi:glycosyltransferase involved in cell wall biosynthesis